MRTHEAHTNKMCTCDARQVTLDKSICSIKKYLCNLHEYIFGQKGQDFSKNILSIKKTLFMSLWIDLWPLAFDLLCVTFGRRHLLSSYTSLSHWCLIDSNGYSVFATCLGLNWYRIAIKRIWIIVINKMSSLLDNLACLTCPRQPSYNVPFQKMYSNLELLQPQT